MAARLGQAICIPCEALGKGCDKGCMAMGKACNWCCGCCEKGCDGCLEWFSESFNQPYACCVSFTVIFNVVPALVYIYYTAMLWGKPEQVGCSSSMDIWLLVELVLFASNAAFGWYMFNRLNRPQTPEEQGAENNSSYSRAVHFFLYDPVVAVYILVGIFAIIWSFVGFSWLREASLDPNCSSIRGNLNSAFWAAVIMLVYVFVGLLLIAAELAKSLVETNEMCKMLCCCCLMCPCCDENESDGNRNARQNRYNAPPGHQVNLNNQNVPSYPAPAPVIIPGNGGPSQHGQQTIFSNTPQPSQPQMQVVYPPAPQNPGAPPPYNSSGGTSLYGQNPLGDVVKPPPQSQPQQPQPYAQPLPAQQQVDNNSEELTQAEQAKQAAINAAKATGHFAKDNISKGFGFLKSKVKK